MQVDSVLFDSLAAGTHFRATEGSSPRKFIKLNFPPDNYNHNFYFVDRFGNRTTCTAIGYDGIPTYVPWDAKVIQIDTITLDTVDVEAELERMIEEMELEEEGHPIDVEIIDESVVLKKVLDSIPDYDRMFVSTSSTTSVGDGNGNKNKQIESSNTTMNTTVYNTLKEAVIAAINELKSAGQMSAHQITTLIREKCNQGEWEVTECAASPNGAGIKFWINHDEVRRNVNEMFANTELDALGFTNRTFNGTYLVYYFDTNQTSQTAPTQPTTQIASTPSFVVGATANPPTVPAKSAILSKIQNYVNSAPGTVTLRQIHSALKSKGTTCQDLKGMVEGLGYNVSEGPNGPDYYSQYVVG